MMDLPDIPTQDHAVQFVAAVRTVTGRYGGACSRIGNGSVSLENALDVHTALALKILWSEIRELDQKRIFTKYISYRLER